MEQLHAKPPEVGIATGVEIEAGSETGVVATGIGVDAGVELYTLIRLSQYILEVSILFTHILTEINKEIKPATKMQQALLSSLMSILSIFCHESSYR